MSKSYIDAVGHYLATTWDGPERLSLFRTSKALAGTVLQHAPCITLSMRPASSSSTQLATAMELATHAAGNVVLAMHDQLIAPLPSLWRHVTSIHLFDMQLSLDLLSPLMELSNPHHLNTLRLKRCFLRRTLSKPGTPATHPTLTVHTLECVQCNPAITYNGPCLSVALSFVNNDQLQHLITDSLEDATTYLPQLPRLQQLRMLSPDVIVVDEGLRRAFSHPACTHLTVWRLSTQGDHSATQPVSLQEIIMRDGCRSSDLACLPLQHLRRCHIHTGMLWNANVSKVQPYQDKIVCHPAPHNKRWDFVMPLFNATLPYDEAGPYDERRDVGVPRFHIVFPIRPLSVDGMQRAFAICGAHLQGAIYVDDPMASTLPALRAGLPPNITSLCFSTAFGRPNLPQEGTFINDLPAHVNHVVLSRWAHDTSVIRQLLIGIARTIKVTFHDLQVLTGDHSDEADMTRERQRAMFLDLVKSWLSSCPSGSQVEVELTGGFVFYRRNEAERGGSEDEEGWSEGSEEEGGEEGSEEEG